MIRYLVILNLLGMALACQQPAKAGVSEVPDDKMARIMADIAVADGGVAMLSGYKKDSLSQAYYQQVWKMNEITLEQYEQYLRILADDTPRLESVLQKAEQLLLDKLPPKEKPTEKPTEK